MKQLNSMKIIFNNNELKRFLFFYTEVDMSITKACNANALFAGRIFRQWISRLGPPRANSALHPIPDEAILARKVRFRPSPAGIKATQSQRQFVGQAGNTCLRGFRFPLIAGSGQPKEWIAEAARPGLASARISSS
jgi:hypothetical protein